MGVCVRAIAGYWIGGGDHEVTMRYPGVERVVIGKQIMQSHASQLRTCNRYVCDNKQQYTILLYIHHTERLKNDDNILVATQRADTNSYEASAYEIPSESLMKTTSTVLSDAPTKKPVPEYSTLEESSPYEEVVSAVSVLFVVCTLIRLFVHVLPPILVLV